MNPLKMAILVLCIALWPSCSGCATTVKVVNFSESEFYQAEKDGVKFYCLSDYYLKEVMNAKIKQVNP
jgi:hypothetical protein